MKRRRVGTLTMGLLLIGLGVLLFYAQFNAQNVLGIIKTWWPLLLFMLGAEVLWFFYTAKEENPKIKYDLFSIFIIFLIIISGLGVYGLTQIGLMSRLQMMVSAQHFAVPIPTEEVVLDHTIKKIVVDSSGLSLCLRTGKTDAVTAYGEANVTADSRETAEKLLVTPMMVSRNIGDTLYLSFNFSNLGREMNYHASISEFTVIVPGDRQIEVESNNYLEVAADGLQNRLSIDSGGSVQLKVPEEGNYQIEAFVRRANDLRGNVGWEIKTNKRIDNNKAIDKDNNETKEMENRSEPEPERDIMGQLKLGNGQYKITVICRNGVTVNRI